MVARQTRMKSSQTRMKSSKYWDDFHPRGVSRRDPHATHRAARGAQSRWEGEKVDRDAREAACRAVRGARIPPGGLLPLFMFITPTLKSKGNETPYKTSILGIPITIVFQLYFFLMRPLGGRQARWPAPPGRTAGPSKKS